MFSIPKGRGGSVSQEFCIWQNYPSTIEEVLRKSQVNRPTVQEITNETPSR